MATFKNHTGIVKNFNGTEGWVISGSGKTRQCIFRTVDMPDPTIAERIRQGVVLKYDIVPDDNKPGFHKAIVRAIAENNFKSIRPRIDLMPPAVDGDVLRITAHYYEDGIAKDEVRLFAYAGDKSNPMIKPLEDLPGKDDSSFDLYTWNYGVANSNVLISELPPKCCKITVIGPTGIRESKEFSKNTLKLIKGADKSSIADKKKTVNYDLSVNVINGKEFSMNVTGDSKPVKSQILLRIIGNQKSSIKLTDLVTDKVYDEKAGLSSEIGEFHLTAQYSNKSLKIEASCPEFNLRKHFLLWES